VSNKSEALQTAPGASGATGYCSGEIGTAALADLDLKLEKARVDPLELIREAGRRALRHCKNPEDEHSIGSRIRGVLGGARIIELAETFNVLALRQALAEFDADCETVTRPKPVESGEDQVRRYRLGGIFRARGWGVEEVELVPLFIEPGELLGEVRAAEIKIGNRWVKRATIRERMTSVGMQPSDRVAALEEAEMKAVFEEKNPRSAPPESWGSGPHVAEWNG